MTEETCDQCKEKGVLGRDIRAFRFLTLKGTPVVRYLHPTGDAKRCYHLYEEKYKAWIEQQKAKANG
jgi:MOSC domain-containing protein YiiM